jgi:YD repeat-containing protein
MVRQCNLQLRSRWPDNKPLTITDPRGLVTALTYEAGTGNLLSVVADSATLGLTTSWTWNACGDPLTVTDPKGNLTTSTYDTGRRA